MGSTLNINDSTVISTLEVLLKESGIRGGVLMQLTRLKADELSEAVQFLREQKLIQVDGNVSKEKLPFATISIRPSQIERIHSLLSQGMSRS